MPALPTASFSLTNLRVSKLAVLGLFALTSCHPTPGPDKSLIGGFLGASWGAGAGAVVGNQASGVGPGALVGSGFGLASGLVQGIGVDIAEGTELQQQRDLDALRVRVASNQRALATLQHDLDIRDRKLEETAASSGEKIFFDSGRASIRSGSAKQLERLAKRIKSSPYVGKVVVLGHSDDAGNSAQNQRLSDLRAKTVSTFLSTYGVPSDLIVNEGLSATVPLASNKTVAGRQLNRRVEVILESR